MKYLKNKPLTQAEEKAILEITRKNIYAVEERGSLETMRSDRLDFFEISVGVLRKL